KTNGDTDQFHAFHFGRKEMQRRRNQPFLVIQKYLDGYHTSLLLVMGWLLLFMLVIFSGIYLGLGTVNSVTDAIFHSLWLSRFLTDKVDYASSDASRFVQVFQLLIVLFLAKTASDV